MALLELTMGGAGSDRVLAACYGCAAVLLVLYFVFENGPCHWSQRREGLYVAVVLGLPYTVSVLWSEGNAESSDFHGVLKIQQLLRLVLVYRLLRRFMIPDAHPRFFDRSSAREAARHSLEIPNATSKWKAWQLNNLIEAMSSLAFSTGGNGVRASDTAFEASLLCMLMLEDLMWAFKDLSQFLNFPLLAMLILLPLAWLYPLTMRYCRLRRLRARVHMLLVDIVDHGAEEVLRCVLATINVGTLMEIARWDTIRQLTDRALEEKLLCPTSKAILVEALQLRGIRYSRTAQHAVRCLIFSCKGKELTTLKNLIDGSGGYHNLYKLVYSDITSHACRREVLGHLFAEAAHMRKTLGQAVGVKVMSDIDDTLVSSGGHFPAGCDSRYPRRSVYPGFLSLVRILDRTFEADVPSCNLVFLSARPHVYKDASEAGSYQHFRSLVGDGRMHSFPTLLPGRLLDSLWATVKVMCIGRCGWMGVGKLKFKTYQNFRDLYREYDFCFCGDNGQGDLLTGQLMLREQGQLLAQQRKAAGPGTACLPCIQGPRLLCVLIHRVTPDSRALALEPPRERGEAWRKMLFRGGLILHEDYVGAAAALHSYDPTLISAEQLAEVGYAAMDEFNFLRWAGMSSMDRWKTAEQGLQRSLRSLGQVLSAAGRPPLPSLKGSVEMQRLRASVFEESERSASSAAVSCTTSGAGSPKLQLRLEGVETSRDRSISDGTTCDSGCSSPSTCSPASGFSVPTRVVTSMREKASLVVPSTVAETAEQFGQLRLPSLKESLSLCSSQPLFGESNHAARGGYFLE